jgi:hypothetical protein
MVDHNCDCACGTERPKEPQNEQGVEKMTSLLERFAKKLREGFMFELLKLRGARLGYKMNRKIIRSMVNDTLEAFADSIEDTEKLLVMGTEDTVTSPKFIGSLTKFIEMIISIKHQIDTSKEVQIANKIACLASRYAAASKKENPDNQFSNTDILAGIDSLISKGQLPNEFRAFADKRLAEEAEILATSKKSFRTGPLTGNVLIELADFDLSVSPMDHSVKIQVDSDEIRRLYDKLTEAEATQSDPESTNTDD